MRLRLPIPIFHKGEIFPEIEIVKPKNVVFLDTRKVADSGDKFSAITVFISGCITVIFKKDGQEISDKISIKTLVRHMAYRSAEYVVIQVMLLLNSGTGGDGIEGVYHCPVCKTPHYALQIKEGEEIISDSRDFISQLKIKFMEEFDFSQIIYFEFENPVKIVSGENVIEEISNISIMHPTLDHCIKASQKFGQADDMRLQYAIYVEALVIANSRDVDNRFKNMFGMLIFEQCDSISDMREFATKVNEYGLDKRLVKKCRNCGKEWKAVVDTSNFFDFDLQPM